MVGHLEAAGSGHILDDDARTSWNVIVQVACEQPTCDVGASGRRATHHQADRLVPIEACGTFLRGRRCKCTT